MLTLEVFKSKMLTIQSLALNSYCNKCQIYKKWRKNMSKVAIMTDSNSGITQKEAKKLGVYVIPMPFLMGDETYYEDINLTQEGF